MRKSQNKTPPTKGEELPFPPLPSQIRTKGGVDLDPRQSLWSYQDGLYSILMDFSTLNFTPLFMNSFRLTLIWFVENRAPSTFLGHFRALKNFAMRVQRNHRVPLGEIS